MHRSCGRTPLSPALLALVLCAVVPLAGCRKDAPDALGDAGSMDAASGADAPDAHAPAPPAEADAAVDGGGGPVVEPPRCPADMVLVAQRFCVDRHEAMFVVANTGQPLSPYYPPTRRLAAYVEKRWQTERLTMGSPEAQKMPLPPLPLWEKSADFEPRAVSKKGVTPQAYTSGKLAALGCKNAGKRLCTLSEWRTACRGEANRPFPYGHSYVRGRCNVFREDHPAKLLHDDFTIGHNDPRLNLVKVAGRPLLRKTGDTKGCMSEWQGDAIFDMVGNLDEWIEDPEGTFVGGFYARATRDGCDSIIASHSYDYADYSTGVRCCADLKAAD